MEQQQQLKEFYELSERAMSLLHAGIWRLRLAISPSFGEPRMLGIASSGKTLVVTWRVWRRLIDTEKLRTPVERMRFPTRLEPTIEQGSSPLSAETLSDALDDLAKLQVSALPPRSVFGTDGTGFDVFAGQGFHSATFRWWNSYPAEWKPLMTWFAKHWKSVSSAASAGPEFTDLTLSD